MAKASRGGRRSTHATTNVVAAPRRTNTISNIPKNVTPFTDNDATQLRNVEDDRYDPDVVDAIKLYISDSNPNGDGYSHSQNLNYKLDNGLPLNPNEKFIDDNIQTGMHEIGKSTNLVRYAHDDILKAMGVQDYSKLTDKQLQKQLVGTTFATTSYTSTSYDGSKSPFAPNQALGGGREVVINIKAGEHTKMVFGARKQAEMILNKGTTMKVTGIHFDGTYATPRNRGTMPRVILDVETY